MSEVNPFEPWRPRESGPGAGGEDVYPWRTPPQDQGLPDPEDRNVPHYERRGGRGPALGDGRVPPPSGANSFSVLLLVALLISTLIGAGSSGGNHLGRYAAAAACLWLGCFIGLSLMFRSGWLARLGMLATGVGSAAACWMLVPTSGGLSWWAARERLQALSGLAPGDVAGFLGMQREKEHLAKEFPGWAADIRRAEGRWALATAGAVEAEVEALAKKDAGRALARVAEVQKALAGSPEPRKYQPAMPRAWEAATRARLEEITKAANAFAEKGLYPRAHDTAQAEGDALQKIVEKHAGQGRVRDHILALRSQLLDRHVKDGVELLDALLARKEYEAVGREGRRLSADLDEAGKPLGRHEEAKARLSPARRKAVEARMEAVHRAASTHLDGNDPDKASAALAAGVKELEGEALSTGAWGDLQAGLLPLRRRALALRIGRAAKEAEALLAKKDHVAAGAKCREAMDGLSPEARQVGEMPSLLGALEPPRRKAWAARLDAAREELRALLVKDEFEAAGKLGEKAGRELASEAAALGSRKELDDFTSRCRAIAKLAAAAGKKE